jgi:hypothetical protein
MNDNPLLLFVQCARNEAEPRRIMERALAEATPLEKAGIGAPSSPGHRARLRHTPVVTKGVSGTMPGTDPLGALLAEGIHA